MMMFCANHATTAAAADAACCAARTFSHNITLILDAALLASIFAALISSLLLETKKVHTVPVRCTASVPA